MSLFYRLLCVSGTRYVTRHLYIYKDLFIGITPITNCFVSQAPSRDGLALIFSVFSNNLFCYLLYVQ